MTKWEGKNVSVFGLGKSGFAIAERLLPLGVNVFITDAKEQTPETVQKLKELKISYELGEHTDKAIENKDLIVLSPGVNPDLQILQTARKNGVQIISEIELAYRFFSKPIIAITGTNGKTTTTTLIGELLRAGGKKVAVGGNIGVPLISMDDSDLDFIVAEISSFQLQTIVSFRPWISLLLNITEDHIERHKSLENYAIAKSRIFLNQKKSDFLIYNGEDPNVLVIVKRSEATLIPFTKKGADDILGVTSSKLPIKGEHNVENAMAATLVAKIVGIDKKIIRDTLISFKGVEHRIEFVCEKNGIEFYNDSKATNPDSTIVALKALNRGNKSIILILGGRDKGTSLDMMNEEIKKRVKKVVLIGEAAKRFEESFTQSGFFDFVHAKDFESAIKTSYSLAEKGDRVLLSPACASFDMFANFEERGRVFKSIAREL